MESINDATPISLTFSINQTECKIIQKIIIDGIVYRIDDLDNLYDFISFKLIKNLND